MIQIGFKLKNKNQKHRLIFLHGIKCLLGSIIIHCRVIRAPPFTSILVKILDLFVQQFGGPFGDIKNFRKKSLNAEKTEKGTL